MRDSKGRFIKGHVVPKKWRGKNRTGWKHSDIWKKEHHTRMLGNKFNCGRIRSTEEKEKNRQAQYRRYDRIGREDCSASLRERHSKRYKNWMRCILQRDDFRCRITSQSGALSAHHIEDFGKNESLRYMLSNGFTMLKILHLEFHKMYGFGNNTKKQLDKFSRECRRILSEIDILSPTANSQKRGGNKYGSSLWALYEVIYRVKAIKFGEPFKLGIPSEAPVKGERVETRQSLPLLVEGKGIVQTTNSII